MKIMEGITASRNYIPGDEIYSETAFAKVVVRKLKDVVCESCCESSGILRACKECLAVKYCDKECQKNDWSSHKLECKRLKNLPKGDMTNFVRLLGKVILKIKDKDWKHIKSNVLGKEFSFDDIECNYKDMVENPRMILFFNEMKELTGKYIGFENLPDDDSLLKIIAKVRLSILRTQTFGLFIGALMFSQECVPNSNAAESGKVLRIWALKTIKKGENKITLPSQAILLPELKISKVDFLSCKCADCSRPYGDSILFKILDNKRAFSVISATESFLEAAEKVHGLLSFPESVAAVDRLLREQEGILGDTNYLRMGLLAIRCLNFGGNPVHTKRLILKLETSMRSVFGEHYIEMLPIYKALCAINLQLGFPLEMLEYTRKAMLIERHLV